MHATANCVTAVVVVIIAVFRGGGGEGLHAEAHSGPVTGRPHGLVEGRLRATRMGEQEGEWCVMSETAYFGSRRITVGDDSGKGSHAPSPPLLQIQ